MKSEMVNVYGEQLGKLFRSPGKRISSTEVPQKRPQDPITTVYEYRSPAGQIYTVNFKIMADGRSLIILDPPVGEQIIASTAVQADALIKYVQLTLELEERVVNPGAFIRKSAGKVLA